MRFFSVGEAISIPLLRATWHAAQHTLPRTVLGRIVKDEAAHGVFGFTVLDWASDRLTAKDRAHLGKMADVGIDFLLGQWDEIAGTSVEPAPRRRRAAVDADRRIPRARAQGARARCRGAAPRARDSAEAALISGRGRGPRFVSYALKRANVGVSPLSGVLLG